MKKVIDPLATAARVTDTYQRYLTTFLPLRDDRLRTALADAVRRDNVMTKGPYLEASPPYSAGATIRDLIGEGVLCEEFGDLCSPALPADRALYRHQEQAVRKAASGRSLVVATGTGSGKTESFLVPILDGLCREKAGGTLTPGVRALLLYPMNALANDQVKRLRELLAGYPDITFGRYTGETEEDPSKAEEVFSQVNPGVPRLPNELISRQAMRETPPHILLTNYAMLEYLLLRPADMELFEGPHGGNWSWLAIDEAHVYSGSLGSELAMLLRRLRDRVAGDRELQAIATSATVGTDSAAVAEFASRLSGASVEWVETDPTRQDVVPATRRELATRGVWGPLAPEEFERIAALEDPSSELVRVARAAGWDGDNAGDAIAAEDSVVALRRTLGQGPRTIADLTSHALSGPHPWTPSALAACVRLASSFPDSTGTPTLSARYHLFAKAAEGAFTCLGGKGPHVVLTRHERCTECADPAFEIGSCTRCGHVHLCGRVQPHEDGDHFEPTPRSDLRATWLLLDPPHAEGDAGVLDEDDAVLNEEPDSPEQHHVRYLCCSCGLLQDSPGTCASNGCSSTETRAVQLIGRTRSEVRECLSCGQRGRDIIRPFSTGNDAAASVLATSLYQEIPAEDDGSRDLPGQGRKLLLFSDSRQSASFFASYLETSFSTIRRRSLVLGAVPAAVQSEGGPAFVEDVITEVAKAAQSHQLFSRRDSRQVREAQAGLWVMQELLSLDDRQSLEGLGQVSIRLARDPSWATPPPLLALGLSEEESWAFLETLVRTLRTQGAVTMPDRVAADDEAFSPRRGPIYVRSSGSESKLKVLSWLPSRAGSTNRRLSYVQKVLRALGQDDAAATTLLDGCWRFLSALPDGWLESRHHAAAGAVWQVDHTWLRLDSLPPGDAIFRCSACHRLTAISVRAVCAVTGCDGTLARTALPLPDEDTNHYRNLYRSILPIGMSVREHTAQWISTKAAEIQQDFVKGRVNVLSCSTTFELGVDVGELQSVMMRNVPPTTANYLQRAGRAGRRTSSAAVVLTYAQRRPHDLARFLDPTQMISGEVRVPYVHLDNDRIDRRHAHSVAIAHFFRDRWTTMGRQWRQAGDFFLDGEPTGAQQLISYLQDPPAEVTKSLHTILPAEVAALIGVDSGAWATDLCQLIDDVTAELARDVDEFEQMRVQAFKERKDFLVSRYSRIGKTLREQQLLGYLSQHNVLPKYGFPVDTVDLRTMFTESQDGASVQLTRDLTTAIYEYAPGAQVVAGGHLWTSGGVYRMPGKGLEERNYSACTSCGHFSDQVGAVELACAACGERLTRKPPYAKPVYGFVAARTVGRPGMKPPERAWRGATYVRRMSDDLVETQMCCPGGELDVAAGPRGQLVAISEGAAERGFWICDFCGWGTSVAGKMPSKHTHLIRGGDCRGSLRQLSLGHQYETDLMRLSGGPWAEGLLQSRSVLYAILEGGSRQLDIARDDIDGSLYMAEDGKPSLVLFDTVPGGAGNVLRIAKDLPAVLERALSLVEECECGAETSCFACLRTFRNERHHEDLRRQEASELLKLAVAPPTSGAPR